ncbi:MAG TPA: hypothetical protein VIX19_14430 [Terriglobales bacterium]
MVSGTDEYTVTRSYIEQKYPMLHGLILLAAGARPIDQISAEQVQFQLKHDGTHQCDVFSSSVAADSTVAA